MSAVAGSSAGSSDILPLSGSSCATRSGTSQRPGGNVEPCALISRTFAEVGEAVGAQHVDRARNRLVVGPLARHQRNAGLDLVAHAQHQTDFGAIVEQPNLLAIS